MTVEDFINLLKLMPLDREVLFTIPEGEGSDEAELKNIKINHDTDWIDIEVA